jgi:hypothetical protein
MGPKATGMPSDLRRDNGLGHPNDVITDPAGRLGEVPQWRGEMLRAPCESHLPRRLGTVAQGQRILAKQVRTWIQTPQELYLFVLYTTISGIDSCTATSSARPYPITEPGDKGPHPCEWFISGTKEHVNSALKT